MAALPSVAIEELMFKTGAARTNNIAKRGTVYGFIVTT
jgi:hypothetical protein